MEVDEDSQADVPTRVAVDTTTSAELLRQGDGGPLRAPPVDVLRAQVQRSSGGARLGRYALLRVLGEGGMGVVFAAYDEELDRRVAIKLLTPRGGAAQDREWLLGEAKAMARLSHPNIVQVYDVGTYDGQLFLAMEFVVGATLREWLQERPRSWREVVAVMIEAGRGLQAAHEAGLVHCDFKPHNVLVAGDGRVRVLDFGLALLQTRGGPRRPPGAAEISRVSMVAGTPAYMAPELHLRAQPDARSDQFAFCVTLYEALYGRRPFTAATAQGLEQALIEAVPPTPPADARVPAWLRRAVLRGLAGDPTARWPGMAALLGELARDPARSARRWLLAAATAGVAAVLAWTLARQRALEAELQAHRCDDVGDLAGVWDPGRREAVRAAISGARVAYAADTWRRVADRLDDYAARWSTIRVAACELHDRGAQSDLLYERRVACLEQRRAELAALVDVLGTADAGVVTKAVRATADLRPLEPCADAERLLSPVATPDTPEAAAAVGRLRRTLAAVRAELLAGRLREAQAQLDAAMPAVTATRHAPLIAEAKYQGGLIADGLGDYKAAAELHEAALWAAEESRHELVAAEAAIRLAFEVGVRLTKFEDAAIWERLAAAAQRRHGARELEIRLLSTRATIASRRGDFAGARAGLETALDEALAVYGPRHFEVAVLLSNLGSIAGQSGDHARAGEYSLRALELLESLLGPDHPDVATIAGNAGSAAIARADYPEAERLLTRALTIYERSIGAEHPDIARLLNNLASVRDRQGAFEDARVLHERALAMRRKLLGDNHTDTANSAANLGDTLLGLGRAAEARGHLARAVEAHRAAVGVDHPRYGAALALLGAADVALGDEQAGVEALERGLSVMSAAPAPPREHLAAARFALARALARRDPSRAQELAQAALHDFAASGPPYARERDEVAAWLAAAGG
jgi:tetratricopeptide (TPR) repeat protein/predicted Ser/Thr protein kinase